MQRRPTITCVGDDGVTVMKYFKVCDPHLAAEDIGWVLVVDGPEPLEPQYVTPTEVAGDLRSMGLSDEDVLFLLLRSGTEEMLDQLRALEAPAVDVAAMERELDQLPRLELP